MNRPRMTRNQKAILALLDPDEGKDTHTLAAELTEATGSVYGYDATFSILHQLTKTGAVERTGRPAIWYRNINTNEES